MAKSGSCDFHQYRRAREGRVEEGVCGGVMFSFHMHNTSTLLITEEGEGEGAGSGTRLRGGVPDLLQSKVVLICTIYSICY